MKSIANVDQIETHLKHRWDNGKFNFLLFSNRIEFTANKPPNYSQTTVYYSKSYSLLLFTRSLTRFCWSRLTLNAVAVINLFSLIHNLTSQSCSDTWTNAEHFQTCQTRRNTKTFHRNKQRKTCVIVARPFWGKVKPSLSEGKNALKVVFQTTAWVDWIKSLFKFTYPFSQASQHFFCCSRINCWAFNNGNGTQTDTLWVQEVHERVTSVSGITHAPPTSQSIIKELLK